MPANTPVKVTVVEASQGRGNCSSGDACDNSESSVGGQDHGYCEKILRIALDHNRPFFLSRFPGFGAQLVFRLPFTLSLLSAPLGSGWSWMPMPTCRGRGGPFPPQTPVARQGRRTGPRDTGRRRACLARSGGGGIGRGGSGATTRRGEQARPRSFGRGGGPARRQREQGGPWRWRGTGSTARRRRRAARGPAGGGAGTKGPTRLRQGGRPPAKRGARGRGRRGVGDRGREVGDRRRRGRG